MAASSSAVIQNIQLICIGAVTAASGLVITGGVNVALGIAGIALLKGAILEQKQSKALTNKIKAGLNSLQGPDFEGLNLDVVKAALEDNTIHFDLTPSHLIEVATKDANTPMGDALAKYIFDRFTFIGNSEQEQSAVKTLLKIGMNEVVDLPVFRENFKFHATRYIAAYINQKVLVQAALEKLQAENDNLKQSAQVDKDLARQQQQTIQTLVAQKGKSDLPFSVDDALKAIADGDNSKADVFFDLLITDRSSAINEAAELFRQKGALWYGSDSSKAIAAYKRATELDGANVTGWNHLGGLYNRVGNFNDAHSAYQKVLDLSMNSGDKSDQSLALSGMGNVFHAQCDFGKAIEMYQKSLIIDKELGSKDGMGASYSNIGGILHAQGDLDQALSLYNSSLSLFKSTDNSEATASIYSNMGLIFQDQSELGQAMQMYQKALATNGVDGSKHIIASVYGNMGIVFNAQGDLDQAMQMYQKSLGLYIRLSIKEGEANQYGNMAGIYLAQEDLGQAMQMYQKALHLFDQLGHSQGKASQYSSIGVVLQRIDKLDEALWMHRKALAINNELCSKKYMAVNYVNMGIIFKLQGDLDQAREVWNKALVLFTELGSPHVAMVQSYLDCLDD